MTLENQKPGPGQSPSRIFHRPWFKPLFAILLVLECVVILEVVIRYTRPVEFRRPASEWKGNEWGDLVHRKSDIPGVDYEMSPNVTRQLAEGYTVATNSYGFRDEEPLPITEDQVIRILVLGDSFTFGFGVRGSETYPSVLERKLNGLGIQQDYRFDVLNYGVCGYSTREEALMLKHKGLSWNPQVVVIGYVLNDPEQEPFQPLHALYRESEWWQYSHLARLVAALNFQWNINKYGEGDYYEALHANGSKNWQSVLTAFQEIRDVTKERDIPVILSIFPDPPLNGWDNYKYRGLHEKVSSAAQEAGFHVVDLYEVFANVNTLQLRVSRSDHHPSPLAHCLVAEAILRKIAELSPLLDQDKYVEEGCSPPQQVVSNSR